METPGLRRAFFVGLAALVLTACAVVPAHAGPKNQIKVFMLNTGVDPDARGRLLFVENKAQLQVKLKVTSLAPGSYDVLLGGTVVDTLVVGSDGEGMISYRSRLKGSKPSGPLPYDPRGETIEIAQVGVPTTYLACDVPETPTSGKTLVEIDLLNMGVQPAATAEAEFEEKYGRMTLEVEVEGMLPGTYDLVVGGADAGDIVVGSSGEAELELDSRPCSEDGDGDDCDDVDELLTFDPRGQVIEIREQGTGTVLFAGTI